MLFFLGPLPLYLLLIPSFHSEPVFHFCLSLCVLTGVLTHFIFFLLHISAAAHFNSSEFFFFFPPSKGRAGLSLVPLALTLSPGMEEGLKGGSLERHR